MNLKYITLLPDDLIQIINSYLNNKLLISLNKYYFNKLHKTIYKSIYNFNSYLRDIIRSDSLFIFSQIMQDNKIINKTKGIKIKYKDHVFINYNSYINYLIDTYNSNKIQIYKKNNEKIKKIGKSENYKLKTYKIEWN